MSPTVKLSDLGAWIAIAVFVATQFVEVSLFDISNFPVTLQKVLALVLYPLSVILMGRIRVEGRMVLFALTLIVSYTMAFFVNAYLPPEAISAIIVVLIGFTGATVLYTAVTLNSEKNFRILAYVWLAFSVGTALITILQAVGLFPFLTVPDEYIKYREATAGLYRGVGLKFDPNFQALVLVIGLVFALFYVPRVWIRLLVTSVIFLGIVGTFSRMGLLLAGLLVAIKPAVQVSSRSKSFVRLNVRLVSSVLAVFTIGLVLYVWGPPSFTEYLRQRFADIGNGLALLVSGESASSTSHLSSAETRALLARAALALALQNWALGVGAYQTDRVIFEYAGIFNVAHNTYLELFLIGGVWGILSILCYAIIVLHGLRFKGCSQPAVLHRNVLLAVILVFAFAGLFLSLTYNSIIWLPLVMALAARKQVKGRHG